jgi:hypothetical protein
MGNVPRSLGQSGRGGVGDQHLDRSTRASRASVALSHSSDDTTSGSWPYSLSLAMGSGHHARMEDGLDGILSTHP